MDTVNSEGHVTVRMGKPPQHYFITTTQDHVKLSAQVTSAEQQQAASDRRATRPENGPEEEGPDNHPAGGDDGSGSNDSDSIHGADASDEELDEKDETTVEATSANQSQNRQERKMDNLDMMIYSIHSPPSTGRQRNRHTERSRLMELRKLNIDVDAITPRSLSLRGSLASAQRQLRPRAAAPESQATSSTRECVRNRVELTPSQVPTSRCNLLNAAAVARLRVIQPQIAVAMMTELMLLLLMPLPRPTKLTNSSAELLHSTFRRQVSRKTSRSVQLTCISIDSTAAKIHPLFGTPFKKTDRVYIKHNRVW